MKFKELADIKEIELLNDVTLGEEDIEQLYIGDLLSRVISRLDEHSLWLTVQAQMNALAVASLSECPVIIFTEDVSVDESLISKATQNNITLFKTKLTSGKLSQLLTLKGL